MHSTASHPIEPHLPTLRELGSDLAITSKPEAALILAKPFLFAALFALAAHLGHWELAPVAIFFLFVAIVSSAHDAVHGSLGLSPRTTDWALFALGALVLESGHAYRLTHLRHHSVFPGDDDPEGLPAHQSTWGAIASGPGFLVRLWVWAWRRAAPAQRRWLGAEALWAGAAAATAMAASPWSCWPLVYVAMVVIGSWVYPLLTAHLPHRHFGMTPLTQTHTLRGTLIPALFFELTYHLEHHLYPRVPTHHLPELSRRLAPTLAAAGVEPWRVP